MDGNRFARALRTCGHRRTFVYRARAPIHHVLRADLGLMIISDLFHTEHGTKLALCNK